jgi:hypothetical protein
MWEGFLMLAVGIERRTEMKKRILALLAAMTEGGGILDFPKGPTRKDWSEKVQGKRETERRLKQVGKLEARKEKENG